MFTRRRLLALAGAGCVMALMVGRRPISDVDLFWQLRLGQLIREGSGIGAREPFTYTHAGEAFPAVCWLAQVVYATLYDFGQSFRVLQIFDNLLFVGALLFAGLSVRPREARTAAIVGGLALGFLTALPHNSLRPQTFALCCYGLLFALHASDRPAWFKILGGALILVAWQNFHPSVMVAGAGLTAFLAADVWAWWRGRAPRQFWTTAALIALAGVCQFATPTGLGVLAVSSRNAWLAVHLPEPCPEWLPSWDRRMLSVTVLSYWIPLAVTLVLLARARFRMPTADLLLLGLMSVLGAWAMRFGFFMGVALVPVWSRLLDKALPTTFLPEGEAQPGGRSVRRLIMPAVLAVVAAAALSVLTRPQLFIMGVPNVAVTRLKTNMTEGRVYNFSLFGGLLVLEPGCRYQLLMDGRIYVFNDAEWDEYFAAAAGRVPVDDLVTHYSPDAFMLHADVQAGLIERLREHPRWQEIYTDRTCCVFVHKDPVLEPDHRGN